MPRIRLILLGVVFRLERPSPLEIASHSAHGVLEGTESPKSFAKDGPKKFRLRARASMSSRKFQDLTGCLKLGRLALVQRIGAPGELRPVRLGDRNPGREQFGR
jgi:hypothetical protein